jgi:hypothetical protein
MTTLLAVVMQVWACVWRVWLAPASLTLRYPRSEIAYRRVEDLEPATLSVAWPQHSRSAAVAAFVRAAAKVAAAQPVQRS